MPWWCGDRGLETSGYPIGRRVARRVTFARKARLHRNPRRSKSDDTRSDTDAETSKASPRLPSGLLTKVSRSSATVRSSYFCSSSARRLVTLNSAKILVKRTGEKKTAGFGVSVHIEKSALQVRQLSGRTPDVVDDKVLIAKPSLMRHKERDRRHAQLISSLCFAAQPSEVTGLAWLAATGPLD